MTDSAPDMSLRRLARGFACAFAGVAVLVRTQRSARIHLFFTLLILGIGAWLRLPGGDWCWLILAIAMVWFAEAINTSVEFLSDVICPGFHPAIKHVKDMAAAAVLFAVIGAIAIGALVLGPPLWARLSGS